MHPYRKFGAMIAIATVIMYGLMYLNTYQLDHVYFSQTRMYMAFIMGGAMSVIMLAMMQQMYPDRRMNLRIYGASALVFVLSLWLVRSQATVGDVAWMEAMIPHHSIAILTSKRANISDPRVRTLADSIIAAQLREIGEMKALITDLKSK